MFGVIAVVCVGNGTVKVALPVSAVARACASSVVSRMKFTTGRPKPRSAKPVPVIVKLAGGVARSIGFGVIPLTLGAGRVSFTVSVALPIRVKGGVLEVCCQTWACTGPTESPGMFGVIAVACFGNGTVSVVLSVSVVARACAIKVEPRMKFTTGRPKPRFAKPLPVIVKLAGGVARSIVLGVMPLTPAMLNVAVTACAALTGRLQVPVPEQPLPLQPVKLEPAAGVAVSVTAVPLANEAEQVASHEIPTGALVMVPPPAPVLLTVSEKLWSAKVAVTVCAALIVTVQVPVPVQPPPLQPVKAEPAAGVAVSVTAVPLANEAEHVVPHEIPAGVLVMVPLPVPVLLTVSAKLWSANVAVTDVAALIVTVQVPVPVQPPPLQPVKVDPAAGVAVSVTAVPLANAAEQVAPQEMPTGALETVPVPAPVLLTVSEKLWSAKVAVTDFAALIVTVQVPVSVQPPPL